MIDNDCDCDPDPDSDTDHFHAHGRTAGVWVTVAKLTAGDNDYKRAGPGRGQKKVAGGKREARSPR